MAGYGRWGGEEKVAQSVGIGGPQTGTGSTVGSQLKSNSGSTARPTSGQALSVFT
ncbi:MAG: hypothetical protein JW918_11735 [Anaerolineae bacterium]|nr:hypothetical protein [Anaerolineae bacterium]